MRGLKKASDILLTIGQVLSFVFAGLYLLCAIVFFVFGSPATKQLIVDGLNNGTITSDFQGDPETVAGYIQIIFIVIAIVFIFLVLFAVANGILIAITVKKGNNKVLYIINIVIGYMSGVTLNMIGAIFGLITCNKVV